MGNDFAKNGTWKIYERRKGRRVKTRRKTKLRKFMEDEKEKGRDVSNVRPSPFRDGAFLVLRSALVESQNPNDC